MSHYRYSQFSRPVESQRPERSFGFTRVLVAVIIIVVSAIVFKIDIAVRAGDHAAALARSQHAHSEISLAQKLINDNPSITFSVASIDTQSSETTWLGSHQVLPAGSVAKVLTGILWLKEVEKHEVKMSDDFSGTSAADQLKLMVNQSDDTAWTYLNDRLGHPALNNYAHSLGLASYQADANTINAADTALLLEKLEQGELLSSQHTALLLSYMQNTNYEDFITPALGQGLRIEHKVGLADDNVNDAAIIIKGRQKLVLVIFTDGHGTQDWLQRASLMQQITRFYTAAYFN